MQLAATVSAAVIAVTLVLAILGILIDRNAFGRGRGEGR
jgi:hypothetical protein